MRILFFTFEYPPLGGGVATASQAITQYLIEKFGISIDLITAGYWGQTPKVTGRLKIYYLPVYLNLQMAQRGPQVWQIMLYLFLGFWLSLYLLTKRYFDKLVNKTESGYDLIHVFGFPSAILGWVFSPVLPYVVSLRGVDVPGYNLKFGKWHLLGLPFTKLAWSRARFVVANSQSLKDLALKTSPKLSLDIIPNGVDTTLFRPVSEEQKLDYFTVSAGGTLLNNKKGLDDLIRGFAMFAHKKSGVQLVLIGDGQNRIKLEALVSELGIEAKVKFMGRRSRAWLADYLPRTHVCCLPSLSESMSNALLEAMACGLPLIVTPPSKYLINSNGQVVGFSQPNEIAVALSKIFADSNLRRSQGIRSRKLAEKLSWEGVAKKYYQYYQQTIHN